MNKLLPSKRNADYDRDNLEQTTLNIEGDKTAWDHYNEKARIEDREYVKDWNENLANLLIFAALFSAILTAFIIESMKLLQRDPQETTNDLLLFMTKQAANATTQNATVLAYTHPEFILQPYVVAINCLFFASLSLSLLAALASIIILQWVGRYDAGILSYPAAKDRALHRQFRYDGVERWRMNDLISALPYLLYFSLVFFFIGMITWLFNTNKAVSVVVSIFFLSGVIAYGITVIVAVVAPSAPFRTPLSDFLTILFYQSSPKSREEKEIESTEGFSLHTLIKLLDAIELVPHSYATLSIVAREIVHQPYTHIFNSRELLLQDRWPSIFQAVLSSFSGNARQKNNPIFRESLADYAVSMIVQELPNAQEHVQNLLQLCPSIETHENVTDLLQRFAMKKGTVIIPRLSPIYVYSLVLNHQVLSMHSVDYDDLLWWLSQTIEIPLEQLETKTLLSETAFRSLLTAAAFLLSAQRGKKKLVTGPILSIEHFSRIVTSTSEDLVRGIPYLALKPFLRNLIIYNCALLVRAGNSSDAVKTVEDIGHLIVPKVQKALRYIPTYELLLAYSKCERYSSQILFRETLEKVFMTDSDRTGNIGFKILIFFDKLLSNDEWYPPNVTKGHARRLLIRPLFAYEWEWMKPRIYSSEDLIVAKDIHDPALRMIASASSGEPLDLHLVNLRASLHDALFSAAAAYWISIVLSERNDSPLSSEEIGVLEILLPIPNTHWGLQNYIRVPTDEYNSSLYRTPGYKLEQSKQVEGFHKRIDQLLGLCGDWVLEVLLRRPTPTTPIWDHITEAVKSTRTTTSILLRIEGSQYSFSLALKTFESFLNVLDMAERFPLIESTCLLWFNLLEHWEFDFAWPIRTINSNLKRKLGSQPDKWFNETLSRIVTRQRLLRKYRLALDIVSGGEDGIWEWHLDLGTIRQVAFAPDDIWEGWVEIASRVKIFTR